MLVHLPERQSWEQDGVKLLKSIGYGGRALVRLYGTDREAVGLLASLHVRNDWAFP